MIKEISTMRFRAGFNPLFILCALLFIQSPSAAWTTDSEPYGFLGCKQLQFRGIWEHDIDSSKLDESTDGICITVALANIFLYYRWPTVSRFDGLFINDSGNALLKRVNHRWRYSLITGKRTNLDCWSDDPQTRHLPGSPSWTGLQEIHKLLYVIERSYGYNHSYFKSPDDTLCYGAGFFAIEHVLRNRFGYPLCRTIDANSSRGRQKAVQNIKNNMPVIAMTCEHVYLLDGYKYDEKKGRELVHTSDYLLGDESMGWFPWKQLYVKGLNRFVVDVSPRFRMLKGPSTASVTYSWGEGAIPGTKLTSKKGRIIIWREKKMPIGNIELQLGLRHVRPVSNKKAVFSYEGNVASDKIILPQKGYFEFKVKDRSELVLQIKNPDPDAKDLMIVLQDFVKRGNVVFNVTN